MTTQRSRNTAVGKMKKMTVFGLRKAFVTPAKKPSSRAKMVGFFGTGLDDNGQWLPE